ncbi:MAG: aspartate/glutamate racemase family protein [Christensenellaceae bacterium]|jgi:glutamate racemase|nr:aspartate/glutamate racemase family protein [Christensenellaceae bacterium]
MNNYILFIDSGIGGTHLLRLTQSMLPHENFLYLADTKNLPYGNKSKRKVTKLVTKAIRKIMRDYPLKMIVLACNTATATSIMSLRERFNIPIVGIEPAIKKALDFGHKNILVIATAATIKHSKIIKKYRHYPYVSGKYLKPNLKAFGTKFKQNYTNFEPYNTRYPAVKLTIKKDIHLATLIETKSSHLVRYINKYQKYSLCDAIVLGCTHYIFAQTELRQIFKNAKFYESSPFVARRIKQVLMLNGTLKNKGRGKTIFL